MFGKIAQLCLFCAQPSMSILNRHFRYIIMMACPTNSNLWENMSRCHTSIILNNMSPALSYLDRALGLQYSEELTLFTQCACDWNSQSAISLHYRLVSPCLVGANWNRLRQLLLTASLMAANERHLCAVDPHVEQNTSWLRAMGRTAQYTRCLLHQSPVNSILINID